AWPDQDVNQDVNQDVVQVDITILRYCMRPKKRQEIMDKIGVYNNTRNFERDVKPLIDQGLLGLTIPDKPNSGNQQYKTTPKGERYLEAQE
ncbi:MAG TPA: AAA family ATPase, partial [Verrucomicrobiae bacterium]|nr:AAA family ATPase [Verrucomicrobiae bacterium]